MVYTPTFEDLAGDEATFFADYFNKAPLLRQGALADHHEDLLSLTDLDEILQTESLRPPYIRVFHNKEAVHPDAYTRPLGVQGTQIPDYVEPSQVMRLFDAGATVTWNALNHFRPNLRAMSDILAKRFSTRIDVMSFLSKPGIQGFRPHFDPVDLFIVQLHGTKRWTVWGLDENRSGGSKQFTSPEQLGKPLWQTSLEPGDVLYLPYNTPHAVMSEDSVSFHLSVMIRPRRWVDLMHDAVWNLLKTDPEFSEFPFLDAADTARLQHEFHAKADRLAKLLTDADPAAAVAQMLSWDETAVGAASEPLISDYVRELEQS